MCLQWGKFQTNKDTESFPVTFTSVYACVGMYNADNTGQVLCNRMPYNVTTSGFSHKKSDTVLSASYIATGKKT